MRSKLFSYFEVACALLAAVGVVALAAAHQDGPVRLIDLEGRPRDLWQAGLDGPVVAIFTRSDCPISNRYAPEVRRLYEEFQPLGVEFALIYVDPRETPEAIRTHLKEYNYPCAALRDPEHELATATGATVTPEAIVFDRSHDVVYRGRINDLFVDFGKSRPEATTHDLEDAIRATLEGRSVAQPVTKAVGCLIADLK
ncbi:MAG: redoxin domain-containing protein [Pirellulales bacterium]